MNSSVKKLVPPLFLDLIRQIKRHHKTYPTFDEALKHCHNPSGYEDPDFINYLVEQTKEFAIKNNGEPFFILDDQSTIYTFLSLPFFLNNDLINIIDVGGGCGMHYFQFKKVVGDKIKFNWSIVETPALCKASKTLENNELHFYENFGDALGRSPDIDLILSSGAIQYFRDPRDILSRIIKANAKYIILSRLSLSQDGSDIITVQRSQYSHNGLEKLPRGFKDNIVEYPHTNMSEKDFNTIISNGYKIKLMLPDLSGVQHINNYAVCGYAVLLEKISQND